ncbi:MAG: methyltransferase domain-containing protein [Chloroflexota bacterium]
MDTLEEVNSTTRQAYNLVAEKYYELFQNEMEEKAFDLKFLRSFAKRFQGGALICDAGCGPCGHIGKILLEKGLEVIGVDISDKCIEIAKKQNPTMQFERGDISNLRFPDNSFDGIIAYYSILDTPKIYVDRVFKEFGRVLKKDGSLLVAVKAGNTEGYAEELLGIETKIYKTLFTEEEIIRYFKDGGFELETIEKRGPYGFEIDKARLFATGKKVA